MDRNLIPLDFNFRETSYRSRFSGDFLSRVRASSGDFHELRPYVSGESGVRVDYRKSDFESGRLVVREYLQEQSFELGIVVFVDPAWRFGTDDFTKFDIFSSSIRCLALSVWDREIVASLFLVSGDMGHIREYPFPRDMGELRACLDLLRDIIFQSEKTVSWSVAQEMLDTMANRSEQVAYCVFSESIPAASFEKFVNRHQVANLVIVHPQEKQILGGVWMEQNSQSFHQTAVTIFGCQVCLNHPDTVRDSIQNGFDIW